MLKIQPRDIIVMPDRGSIYSTYTEWVQNNAPAYITEYRMQSYDGYYTDDCDVLSVICIAPHSKPRPELLCLCRSLLTDKLILVGAADTTLEDTRIAPCNKAIREMLNDQKVDRIYDIIVPRLCPGAYPTPKQEDEIRATIRELFKEFNITYKEED